MKVLEEARARLPGRPASVAAARRFIEGTLRGWGCHEYAEVLRLLAAEIVTNAIVHARSEVDLRVVLLPETIRVEVRDANRSGRVLVPPPEGIGKGLRVVDALAGSWGVEPVETGKMVWVEVRRSGAPGA